MTRLRRRRLAVPILAFPNLALLVLAFAVLAFAVATFFGATFFGATVPAARAQAPDGLPLGVELEIRIVREGDTIGDPVRLTVIVTHPPAGELLVPPPDGPLGQLEPAAPRVTRSTGADGAQRVTLVYETRAFITGRLTLQPPRLSYRTQAGIVGISPPSQIVDVRSLLPADGSLVIRPLNPAQEIPGGGVPRWPVALAAGAAAVALAGAIVRRRRRQHDAAAPIMAAPPDPALAAIRHLDRIRAAGLLPQAIEEFCVRVNATVRGYLTDRYQLPALNLTARELADRLARAGADAGTVQRVRNLCQACDEIAYAGASPSPDRVARYLDLAQAIIRPQAGPTVADPATTGSAGPSPAPQRWARRGDD